MEATTEAYRQIQSDVTRITARYMKEFGVSRPEAYLAAAEEVGKALVPPMSAKGLGSWMAHQRLLLRDQKAQEPVAKKGKGKAEKADASVVAAYRAWISEHDHIAPDRQLAHFNGHTANAFSQARAEMRKEGFEFERTDAGWHITARPAAKVAPRVYSEEEFRQAVTEATSAALGPAVSTAVREALAKFSLGGK